MAGKKPPANLAVAARTLGSDMVADDAFVRGAPKTSKRQSTMDPKRRLTVYLPDNVAESLEMYAVKSRQRVSSSIEDAVRGMLKL
jgi:hypothetical protein